MKAAETKPLKQNGRLLKITREVCLAFFIALLFALGICTPQISIAQEEREYLVIGSKGKLKCTELKNSSKKIFVNAKYDEAKIHKEHDIKINADPSFPGFKSGIHDQFVNAFQKTFTKERLKKLAKAGEKFSVYFDLDQDGNFLLISFVLDFETTVTPDELLTLEENLKNMVKFDPIRKSQQKFLDYVFVKTNFSEIFNGEIPFIRKKDKYLQQLEEIEKIK